MLPIRRPPTERQRQVLDYLEDYLSHHQRPPTRREIAAHFKMKVNAAQGHLLALARRGLVKIDHGLSRAIQVRR